MTDEENTNADLRAEAAALSHQRADRQMVMAAREHREEALQEREQLQRILKATNDAIWEWDLVTNKLWWSEGVHILFGYAFEHAVSDFT